MYASLSSDELLNAFLELIFCWDDLSEVKTLNHLLAVVMVMQERSTLLKFKS